VARRPGTNGGDSRNNILIQFFGDADEAFNLVLVCADLPDNTDLVALVSRGPVRLAA
jgi:hypothetical protein